MGGSSANANVHSSKLLIQDREGPDVFREVSEESKERSVTYKQASSEAVLRKLADTCNLDFK